MHGIDPQLAIHGRARHDAGVEQHRQSMGFHSFVIGEKRGVVVGCRRIDDLDAVKSLANGFVHPFRRIDSQADECQSDDLVGMFLESSAHVFVAGHAILFAGRAKADAVDSHARQGLQQARDKVRLLGIVSVEINYLRQIPASFIRSNGGREPMGSGVSRTPRRRLIAAKLQSNPMTRARISYTTPNSRP